MLRDADPPFPALSGPIAKQSLVAIGVSKQKLGNEKNHKKKFLFSIPIDQVYPCKTGPSARLP
jgi:hypothetical protein